MSNKIINFKNQLIKNKMIPNLNFVNQITKNLSVIKIKKNKLYYRHRINLISLNVSNKIKQII